MDAQAKRAALFLLFAPGALAEVSSQNLPILSYLEPLPFLLVSITYGVPVLLIRELAVARKLSNLGVIWLGLAYGILNEGVLAKSLPQPAGPPLNDFVGYGQIDGLQGGWTIFIVFWHSLHSVLYPMLVSQWIFPAAADRRWFASGRARWVLLILLLILTGLYSLYFLNPVRSAPGIFVLYGAATFGCVAIALRFCRARDASPAVRFAKPSLKPALLGGCALLFYVFQFWSPGHIPFILYFTVSVGIVGFSIASIARTRWRPVPDVLLLGLGDFLTFSVFSALLAVVSGRGPLQAAAAGAVFVALFAYLIRGVMRQPRGRAPPGRLAAASDKSRDRDADEA